ncbi:MAG: twin-arginine translocase TatA/TatE family subunit [Thermoguttaceae bacterium]|nr:twin-arginine translocase TatA/TatE family subunit [Thermoguttaceae bacterium]MDW8079661.1 twin-arginine translocase TatA/TatE family subunit [Thermoguttaceae bacterium]
MFSPSPGEMIIILIIAILLFGEKLPQVARSVGKTFMEFQKGLRGLEREFQESFREASEPPKPKVEKIDNLDQEEATAPKFEPPPA